uniref:Uncharacterized protein n=1 Tax=viral metagenome TaxID=1070528 RepID=A0A6H1ZWM0_9ZZZZ
MNLCGDDHVEICYEEGRNCPACELLKKISDLEDEIYNLKEKIEELQEAE